MTVLGMGRGRKQTGPIMNLIYNRKGHVIGLERDRRHSAPHTERGWEGEGAILCHCRVITVAAPSQVTLTHRVRLMFFKHISIFTKPS